MTAAAATTTAPTTTSSSKHNQNKNNNNNNNNNIINNNSDSNINTHKNDNMRGDGVARRQRWCISLPNMPKRAMRVLLPRDGSGMLAPKRPKNMRE